MYNTHIPQLNVFLCYMYTCNLCVCAIYVLKKHIKTEESTRVLVQKNIYVFLVENIEENIELWNMCIIHIYTYNHIYAMYHVTLYTHVSRIYKHLSALKYNRSY